MAHRLESPLSIPADDRTVFTWKDFSRFVQVAPVERGWLVLWGRFRQGGRAQRARGAAHLCRPLRGSAPRRGLGVRIDQKLGACGRGDDPLRSHDFSSTLARAPPRSALACRPSSEFTIPPLLFQGDEPRSVSGSELSLVHARIASTEMTALPGEVCDSSSLARARWVASSGRHLPDEGTMSRCLGGGLHIFRPCADTGLQLETRDGTTEHLTHPGNG